MQPHDIQKNQLALWLNLTADLSEKISQKPEDEIIKKDIIKIAQKIQDIINVLNGKSKIAGWRF